jgi:hypothetical protein
MESVTLAIAVVVSSLVIVIRPLWGLAAYTAVLVWYPARLTIKIGTADLSAVRIIILVLLVKLLFFAKEERSHFRFIPLDFWIFAYFAGQMISGAFTATDFMDFLENRFGAMFDLMLPYFAVRIVVYDRKQYVRFVKSFVLFTIPYAFMGVYQSITGNNPYLPLLEFAAWGGTGMTDEKRLGLFRANVSMPVHILFGVFFVQASTLMVSIYHEFRRYSLVWLAGFGILGLGAFCSLSSGPFLAYFLLLAFLVFYRYRRHWRVYVTLFVMFCLAIEVMSNRHFYDVIDRFVISSATAWYRSRLLEVAIFEGGMSGHWILGYGYDVDPGWSKLIDLRDHTDIVNHYILVLSRSGLLGLIPFIGMLTAAYQGLHKAFCRVRTLPNRWLIWSLFAGLSSLLVVFFTVSLFGQPQTVFYILLALCGAAPVYLFRRVSAEPTGEPT